MDEEYVISLIESQAEESLNFECKVGFAWDSKQSSMGWVQAQAIQAILGFTNTEGGGLLLLGVKDDGKGNRDFTGLTPEMLQSYSNTEAIQECIDKFADGQMSYSIKQVKHVNDGVDKTYIAIAVSEFKESPVLSTRDVSIKKPNGKEEFIMRERDLYARSRKGRFATVKATSLELKETIRLAHTKDEERLLQLLSSVNDVQRANSPNQTSPYSEMDKDL